MNKTKEGNRIQLRIICTERNIFYRKNRGAEMISPIVSKTSRFNIIEI